MYARDAVIINATGLHARPAAEFVRAAGKYQSKIQIFRKDRPLQVVNAKSMVLVLSLSAAKGTHVTVSAAGPDEQEAVDALISLLEDGFGEGDL